jgi:hypothetical protein
MSPGGASSNLRAWAFANGRAKRDAARQGSRQRMTRSRQRISRSTERLNHAMARMAGSNAATSGGVAPAVRATEQALRSKALTTRSNDRDAAVEAPRFAVERQAHCPYDVRIDVP